MTFNYKKFTKEFLLDLIERTYQFKLCDCTSLNMYPTFLDVTAKYDISLSELGAFVFYMQNMGIIGTHFNYELLLSDDLSSESFDDYDIDDTTIFTLEWIDDHMAGMNEYELLEHIINRIEKYDRELGEYPSSENSLALKDFIGCILYD